MIRVCYNAKRRFFFLLDIPRHFHEGFYSAFGCWAKGWTDRCLKTLKTIKAPGGTLLNGFDVHTRMSATSGLCSLLVFPHCWVSYASQSFTDRALENTPTLSKKSERYILLRGPIPVWDTYLIRFDNHVTSQHDHFGSRRCSLFIRYYSPCLPTILLEISE